MLFSGVKHIYRTFRHIPRKLSVIWLCCHPPLLCAPYPVEVGTMAEIGIVTFARGALRVGQAVLSAYRRRFSQHRFTQPQHPAILCLMR
jgi:hypothetical protein